MKILVLDNYDSFTYNLVHYLEELTGEKVDVFRNDEISLDDVARYDKIVLSPGPGLPDEAGILKPLIRQYAPTKSIFGVCLGMQAIGEVFGGKLLNLSEVYHGVATTISVTDPADITFGGLPAQLEAGRYHSWVVDPQTMPNELNVSAIDHNGQPMAFYHAQYDVRAVQFHPESILTPLGKEMLRNWLATPAPKADAPSPEATAPEAQTPAAAKPQAQKTMRNTLEYLHEGFALNYPEARERMHEISHGMYSEHEVTEFISAYLMRDITAPELTGFRDALYNLALRPEIETGPAVDLCGTGGDSKSTFNISTLASFVVAGAGFRVVKHGNYGVSSKSGSSNVLEHFGAKFSNNSSDLARQLDRSNFCYLHAPLFHPALRHVAPIRKRLGVKTFFNMLGPLLNPLTPTAQLAGVYSPDVAALYHAHFEQAGTQYIVVHSTDGYDEVSLTAPVLSHSNVLPVPITPELFGFESLRPEQLIGGTSMAEAAHIFEQVLQAKGTVAQHNVVVANAALAIRSLNPNKPISDCVALAQNSLEGQKAYAAFKAYMENFK